MTALTKFIIGSIVSLFGSLTLQEPELIVSENLQEDLQEKKSFYVYHSPAKEDCKIEETLTFKINIERKNC